jgi:hypothetical protein
MQRQDMKVSWRFDTGDMQKNSSFQGYGRNDGYSFNHPSPRNDITQVFVSVLSPVICMTMRKVSMDVLIFVASCLNVVTYLFYYYTIYESVLIC